MYRVLNDGNDNGKWLDFGDCKYRSNSQNFDIKNQQIYDNGGDEADGYYNLNLDKKTYSLFTNLAQKDDFNSVLAKGDMLELNREFKVLRKKDENYDASKENERIKIVEKNLDLLLGEDASRTLKKVKTKNRKTVLKFETGDSKIIVKIKKNKISIKVKEKNWLFPKTIKHLEITDNALEMVSDDDDAGYSLSFDEKNTKDEKDAQKVTYRNKQSAHIMTEVDSIENISNVWAIPKEALEAANSPFENIKGKTITIPVGTTREEFEYTVKEGESYRSIAKKLHMSKSDLKDANKVYSLPEPGKKIKIPAAGNNTSKCKYEVKENDTFESIAEKFGVTVQDLYNANKKLGEEIPLVAGTKIKVPETKFDEPYKYKVKDGETIEDIATDHKVDLIDLKVQNSKYADYKPLEVGQKLIIPNYTHNLVVTEGNVQVIPEYEYIVPEGQNLVTLANDLGMSTYTILMANKELIKKEADGSFKMKDNNLVYNPLKPNQKIIIPEHKKVIGLDNKDFKSVAKEVGVSESYIIDILLGIEVGRKKLDPEYDLSPYDDAAPRSEKKAKLMAGELNGTLTIDFGHTGRVFGKIMTLSNWQSISTTEEEAYLMLAQDIMKAKEEAITFFGKDVFEHAPLSIQEALIDIAFNKGDAGFRRSKSTVFLEEDFKEAKEKHDWTKVDWKTVAKHTILEPTTDHGLKRRNLYRIILACRDLPDADRKKVMEEMGAYYNEVYDLFSTPGRVNTRNSFAKAWQDAKDTGWFEEDVFRREDIYEY